MYARRPNSHAKSQTRGSACPTLWRPCLVHGKPASSPFAKHQKNKTDPNLILAHGPDLNMLSRCQADCNRCLGRNHTGLNLERALRAVTIATNTACE